MDPELEALNIINEAIKDLQEDAKVRVVAWLINKYSIRSGQPVSTSNLPKSLPAVGSSDKEEIIEGKADAKRKRSGKTKKSDGLKIKPSSLSLTTDQLSQLKTYFEGMKPTGEETCVFVLASFLDEIINLKTFHGGDVLYVYDQLLPLKPSIRPPALDGGKVLRALAWLTVRSRKKMWLQKNGENFEISAQGRLQIAYDSKKNEHEA